MKTIVIFVAVVVLMAGLAFVVVSNFLAPGDSPGEQADQQEQKSEEGTEPAKGRGEIFMVEELLVNPTGTSGTRYLSASIGLEVANHDIVQRLEVKKLQIRDLLINILSSRTVEQLTNAPERENMRQEITDRLNQIITPDEVIAVYFVDYVLQ